MALVRYAGGTVLVEGGVASREAIRAFVEAAFERFAARLPRPDAGLVILKPNLNSDLSALTGNSTDLRLIATLLAVLRDGGHRDLAVADGPNIGIARTGADVLQRLGVRALARRFGARAIDLNEEPAVPLPADPCGESRSARRPEVARVLLDAAAILNVAKAKTHAEAVLSLSAKNLVGCLRGESKRWLHEDVHERIVSLTRRLRPALHFIDGLYAMEGNGPGDGVPCRLDLLFAGDEPFLLDATAARALGFDPSEVPILAVARREGLIGQADWGRLAAVAPIAHLARAPRPSRAAALLASNATLPVRELLRPLIDARPVREALYGLGLIQDVYSAEDADVAIAFRAERCTRCERCVQVCPVELGMNTPGFDFAAAGCVKCLYCVDVCPTGSYELEGRLGYLARRRAQHGVAIRVLAPAPVPDTPRGASR